MAWFISNAGTIITAAILLGMVALIISFLAKKKKKGEASCGGNCSNCHGGCCH